MSDHRKNLHRYSKQVSSCSSLSYKTPYQPGGTCSIMTGNSTSRFHSSQQDEKLGRWSILHFNLPGSKILFIICCYQCCKQTIQSAGPKTAFSQQWSLLHDSGILHPDPRKQFIKIWTNYSLNWSHPITPSSSPVTSMKLLVTTTMDLIEFW